MDTAKLKALEVELVDSSLINGRCNTYNVCQLIVSLELKAHLFKVVWPACLPPYFTKIMMIQ